MSEPPPELPLPPMSSMRVEPLEYHTPMRTGRPGILTAVGIISVVIGSLSILLNCGSVVNAVMLRSIRSIAIPPTTNLANLPNTPQISNKSGLTLEQRQMVIAAFNRAQDLSAVRKEMLDKLLMETGNDFFPFSGDNYTEAAITANISESGQLPDIPGKKGNVFYIVGNGRIEIGDEEAVFSPAGNQPSVRVGGDPTINNNYAVVQSRTFVGTPVTVNPFANVSLATTILNIVEAGLSMILAIYLLICGIMVLRDSMRGRKMHIVYAWFKLLVAILLIFSYWSSYTQLAMSTGSVPPSTARIISIVMGIVGVMYAAIACIYPVSLLIVMNSKTAKEYYHVGKPK